VHLIFNITDSLPQKMTFIFTASSRSEAERKGYMEGSGGHAQESIGSFVYLIQLYTLNGY